MPEANPLSAYREYMKIYSSLFSKFGSGPLKMLSGLPGIGGFKGQGKRGNGMSNVRFAVTGAAPINPDILKFFLLVSRCMKDME